MMQKNQSQGPQEFSTTDMIKYSMMKQGQAQQIEFLLDLQDIQAQIFATLKGGHYDMKKKAFIINEHNKKQMMTDEGINEIMGMIARRFSRLYSVNKFREEEINARMKLFVREFTKLLILNRNKWNIKKEYISWIVNEITDAVEAGYKKAQNGELIDLIGDTSRVQQTQVIDNNRHSIVPNFIRSRRVM